MQALRHSLLAALLPVALALAAPGPAFAQGSGLAAGQVSGAQLQSWLDADGFVIAGVGMNGCYFMIRSIREGRRQTIDCPGQPAPFSVLGEAKVVGNQFCAKFTYPDGNRTDLCCEMFKVGDNKYEGRTAGGTMVFYRLIR